METILPINGGPQTASALLRVAYESLDRGHPKGDEKLSARTVVLKVSGEALVGPDDKVLTVSRTISVAEQLRRAREFAPGIRIAVVVGGGNILRGKELLGIDRLVADQMGMLATLINALALKDACETAGVPGRVMSAIDTRGVAEPVVPGRVKKHLERDRVVLFAAGLGHPFVTTDTAAAQRAIEVGADALLFAKYQTDGVYDQDPQANPTARFIQECDYDRVLRDRLEVMDLNAVQLCEQYDVPIHVFEMRDDDDTMAQALAFSEPRFGTWIRRQPS